MYPAVISLNCSSLESNTKLYFSFKLRISARAFADEDKVGAERSVAHFGIYLAHTQPVGLAVATERSRETGTHAVDVVLVNLRLHLEVGEVVYLSDVLSGGDVAHVVDVVGAGDDDDLVDVGVAVEGEYGVLDDGLAVHVEKLFGLVGSEAASATAGQ